MATGLYLAQRHVLFDQLKKNNYQHFKTREFQAITQISRFSETIRSSGYGGPHLTRDQRLELRNVCPLSERHSLFAQFPRAWPLPAPRCVASALLCFEGLLTTRDNSGQNSLLEFHECMVKLYIEQGL